ncbi:hypothetical protein CYY_005801 [Polysphondylium violaceum]|uniref:Peptidoglycan binding-like domain-containing protein n=1 Tax=Polysphondylium violaceum TaxID=133409 RepID=A0A8J4PSW9_9MYCE|nr:hypothetical protein CYY_005801 [Polysphondylium violaceum]
MSYTGNNSSSALNKSSTGITDEERLLIENINSKPFENSNFYDEDDGDDDDYGENDVNQGNNNNNKNSFIGNNRNNNSNRFSNFSSNNNDNSNLISSKKIFKENNNNNNNNNNDNNNQLTPNRKYSLGSGRQQQQQNPLLSPLSNLKKNINSVNTSFDSTANFDEEEDDMVIEEDPIEAELRKKMLSMLNSTTQNNSNNLLNSSCGMNPPCHGFDNSNSSSNIDSPSLDHDSNTVESPPLQSSQSTPPPPPPPQSSGLFSSTTGIRVKTKLKNFLNTSGQGVNSILSPKISLYNNSNNNSSNLGSSVNSTPTQQQQTSPVNHQQQEKQQPQPIPTSNKEEILTPSTKYVICERDRIRNLCKDNQFEVVFDFKIIREYKLYVVEEWIFKPNHQWTSVQYTGNHFDEITVSIIKPSTTLTPNQCKPIHNLISKPPNTSFYPIQTAYGNLLLANYDFTNQYNINLIDIPNGDFDTHIPTLKLNLSLKRLGCTPAKYQLSTEKLGNDASSLFFKLSGYSNTTLATVTNFVKELQAALAHLNYLPLLTKIDGQYDQKTINAVKAFQVDYNKTANGTSKASLLPTEGFLDLNTFKHITQSIYELKNKLESFGYKIVDDPVKYYIYFNSLIKEFQDSYRVYPDAPGKSILTFLKNTNIKISQQITKQDINVNNNSNNSNSNNNNNNNSKRNLDESFEEKDLIESNYNFPSDQDDDEDEDDEIYKEINNDGDQNNNNNNNNDDDDEIFNNPSSYYGDDDSKSEKFETQSEHSNFSENELYESARGGITIGHSKQFKQTQKPQQKTSPSSPNFAQSPNSNSLANSPNTGSPFIHPLKSNQFGKSIPDPKILNQNYPSSSSSPSKNNNNNSNNNTNLNSPELDLETLTEADEKEKLKQTIIRLESLVDQQQIQYSQLKEDFEELVESYSDLKEQSLKSIAIISTNEKIFTEIKNRWGKIVKKELPEIEDKINSNLDFVQSYSNRMKRLDDIVTSIQRKNERNVITSYLMSIASLIAVFFAYIIMIFGGIKRKWNPNTNNNNNINGNNNNGNESIQDFITKQKLKITELMDDLDIDETDSPSPSNIRKNL